MKLSKLYLTLFLCVVCCKIEGNRGISKMKNQISKIDCGKEFPVLINCQGVGTFPTGVLNFIFDI